MRRAVVLPALILMAACASTRTDDAPVSAPSPAEISQMKEVNALQAKIGEMQISMTELLERIDVLNARVADLEQVAVVPASPKGGTESTAQTSPVQVVPKGAAPATAPRAAVPAPATRSLASADIADAYRNALMLFGQGRFEDARRAFQKVFDLDHAGDLADNALYWIGETYFSTGNYPEALKYYRRVSTEYADSNKAPDALLKSAVTYEKTGDLGVAKTTLDEVISRYPFSGAAAAAKVELKRIKY